MIRLAILIHTPQIFGIEIGFLFLIPLITTILIPTFFAWRWILKKIIKVYKTRVILTWLTNIIITPLIYIGIYVLSQFIKDYNHANKFSKEKFFNNKEIRNEYSKDIIESKVLIGKSMLEIKQTLGDDGCSVDSFYWFYYLEGTSINDPKLVVEFKKGKVVDVKIGDY